MFGVIYDGILPKLKIQHFYTIMTSFKGGTTRWKSVIGKKRHKRYVAGTVRGKKLKFESNGTERPVFYLS